MWSLGCVIAELFLGWPLYPGASEYDQVSCSALTHTNVLGESHKELDIVEFSHFIIVYKS